MKHKKLHFLFEEGKEPNVSFAKTLIAELGQTPLEEADAIICVGGDGLLLRGLRLAAETGIPVLGITAPHSNSVGFWMNHDVQNADDLLKMLDSAEEIPLTPLKADITFANDNHKTVTAFNSVVIERQAGQAALINLSATFQKASVGATRIMGDGLIFSTALGSTGMNRSYGGPSIDIHNDVVILTGKGINTPKGMTSFAIGMNSTRFHAEFISAADKRPVRIDYDGLSVANDDNGSPVKCLTVSADTKHRATLLVSDEPGVKAFRSITG